MTCVSPGSDGVVLVWDLSVTQSPVSDVAGAETPSVAVETVGGAAAGGPLARLKESLSAAASGGLHRGSVVFDGNAGRLMVCIGDRKIK